MSLFCTFQRLQHIIYSDLSGLQLSVMLFRCHSQTILCFPFITLPELLLYQIDRTISLRLAWAKTIKSRRKTITADWWVACIGCSLLVLAFWSMTNILGTCFYNPEAKPCQACRCNCLLRSTWVQDDDEPLYYIVSSRAGTG